MSALRMISSMASREVLRELAIRFESLHACKVTLEASGGVEVVKRLRAGEPADLVVLARNSIEALSGEGILLADSITDVAQSGIAVAVPASAVPPDISTEAALRRAVEQAATVSYSTGPSGVYLEGKFQAWGLLAALRARIVVPPPGTPVGSLVASGKAALGFQQLSELQGMKGIRVVGLLPEGAQLTTIFSGAVSKTSANRRAGSQLLAYLASPSTAVIKQAFGMEACQAR